MSAIVPPSRPKQTEDQTREILLENKVDSSHKIAILGVRGYYANTMGGPGNDRGIYDDALFLVTENVYAAFNGNTDPSVRRSGIAVLIPGVYAYVKGLHNLSKAKSRQYPALRQAGKVRVWRDGRGGAVHEGMFGINIHRGSRTTTSSEGCQTIHPDQWDAFINLVYSEMKRLGTTKVTYVLIHGEEV